MSVNLIQRTKNVYLSHSLKLKNTLLVPSLATKLISIGQMMEEQNCIVLIFFNHRVVQDILIKEIIVVVISEMNCITWMIQRLKRHI
jgi:hypothetical protein